MMSIHSGSDWIVRDWALRTRTNNFHFVEWWVYQVEVFVDSLTCIPFYPKLLAQLLYRRGLAAVAFYGWIT